MLGRRDGSPKDDWFSVRANPLAIKPQPDRADDQRASPAVLRFPQSDLQKPELKHVCKIPNLA
jgi:hypothetical protein